MANADMWKCQILTATQLTSDRRDQPTNHTVLTVHSYSSSHRVGIQSCEASAGRFPQLEIHLISPTTSQAAPRATDYAISARDPLSLEQCTLCELSIAINHFTRTDEIANICESHTQSLEHAKICKELALDPSVQLDNRLPILTTIPEMPAKTTQHHW